MLQNSEREAENGGCSSVFAHSSFTTRRVRLDGHTCTTIQTQPSTKILIQKIKTNGGNQTDQDRTKDFPKSKLGGLTEDQCRQKSTETNS